MTVPTAEIAAKLLELLKETVPSLSRVTALSNPANSEDAFLRTGVMNAAATVGVRIQFRELRTTFADELKTILTTVGQDRAGALLVLADTQPISRLLIPWAIERRVPAVSVEPTFPRGGGLMSYGPHPADLARRVATLMDRILKGAKPADLPVEQPTRYEFVINLVTAKAIGLRIPQSLLLRADQVIE